MVWRQREFKHVYRRIPSQACVWKQGTTLLCRYETYVSGHIFSLSLGLAAVAAKYTAGVSVCVCSIFVAIC